MLKDVGLLYWPPEDGYPRLKKLSHEILWCLYQGYSSQEIQVLAGPFHSGYVSLVKSRYRARGKERLMETIGRIGEIWPL